MSSVPIKAKISFKCPNINPPISAPSNNKPEAAIITKPSAFKLFSAFLSIVATSPLSFPITLPSIVTSFSIANAPKYAIGNETATIAKFILIHKKCLTQSFIDSLFFILLSLSTLSISLI